MRRQSLQHQISDGGWFKRLAITILAGSFLQTPVPVFAQINNEATPLAINNQATYTYTDQDSQYTFQGSSSLVENISNSRQLIDPLGRILGCGGQKLPSYQGFSVALYEPLASDTLGTELGQLVSLTRTEVPDIPNNNISKGINPNADNVNPFSLTDATEGYYNFLFDQDKGQADQGKTYILVVNPPANSIYTQRRIKLTIVSNTGDGSNKLVQYTATSIDGLPISVQGTTQVSDTVLISDAERIGLDLLPMQLDLGMCQTQQLQIIKTADRAAAEPGDTVIYRLSLKNVADSTLDNIVVNDTLPLGFKFLPQSVRGEANGQAITFTAETSGSEIILRTTEAIAPGSVINIAYATQLTPDAVRGSGRNSAIVNAQRIDNDFTVKDGPATHSLKIRPGIVSDCGTIIGRVFVDKNFDGEQQPGEPGVPNAVIFLEDGNRITTDPNGLFSLANVLPGNHTGVLDLSSLPGYTLAPNVRFRERNSQSRLVRLEPGGMVRMNFAVTPTFNSEVKK
ncbi:MULTISPECIES: DUF7507 domain-containing protein [Calothrix]|uniref:DUF11 domain-containing protein n=2 Tax=Calothrix TaxID=1186 RepID=A0ABR8A2J1_9CYAN|nr:MULTISPECIES: DUF11 domain-containing protein [Calothrix]MBD2194166.1 DUF11 domain-containing protein [Calothrix parietina FACHB-288]MBD2224962.1 DUF11 domain-containing protein [Calothrix anomala FACHB-343]